MNLLMVFAFAGDSTMTRFFAIAERPQLRRGSSKFLARASRERGGTISPRQTGTQNCYRPQSAQAHRPLPLVEGTLPRRRSARRPETTASRHRVRVRAVGGATAARVAEPV